jgi:hypothetical protein
MEKKKKPVRRLTRVCANCEERAPVPLKGYCQRCLDNRQESKAEAYEDRLERGWYDARFR